MNVKLQRLQLVEWLLQVQDEEVLSRVSELRQRIDPANMPESPRPLSLEELKLRIATAEQEIAQGHVFKVNDLLSELH